MVISIERVNIFITFRTVPDTMVSPKIPRIFVGVNREIILSRKQNMVGKSQDEALNAMIRSAWLCLARFVSRRH